MSERPDPRSLRSFLDRLIRLADESEAALPHAILVTDPQTGRQHVLGPYPDRISARISVLLVRNRNERADPDLADLHYEVVPHFGPDD